MPQRAVERRIDKSAGDLGSLVDLGLADPPPEPSMPPPPEVPDQAQSGMEQANEFMLQSALLDSGVEKAAGDEQVIDALAKLDPKDVQAVTAWLRQKKPKDEPVEPEPGPQR